MDGKFSDDLGRDGSIDALHHDADNDGDVPSVSQAILKF